MKKNSLITLLIILIISISYKTSKSQEVLGRWVIAKMQSPSQHNVPTLLTFYDNSDPIDSDLQAYAPNISDPRTISAGAYSYNNYNIDFHVIDNFICQGTGVSNNSYTSTGLAVESQLIKKPGCDDEYYLFYTTEFNLSHSLYCCHIQFDNGEWKGMSTTTLITGIQSSFIGFAITEEANGVRSLFVAAPEGENTAPVEYAGVRKWEISSSGISSNNFDYIINVTNTNLINEDFDAYNMECDIDINGNTVLAWCHGVYDYGNNWEELDEIVVVTIPYNGGNITHKIIDLDEISAGIPDLRIGGIEFSNCESNILYVSTTNRGIVKINYDTYQNSSNIIDVYSQGPDYDYGHTFLQTAPDGHIYGVSNDGTKLGRILQSGPNCGTFDLNYNYNFPTDREVSTYEKFYINGTTEVRYYILPENQRVHNYMTYNVETTPICPGDSDGTATITIDGGWAPYTLVLTKPDNTQVTVTISGNSYTFTNLPIGNYLCTVTDDYDNNIEIEFSINKKPFDVPDEIEPIAVFESEYWTDIDSRSYEYGIQISGNTSVTVTNSKLEFGPDAKIIIEPGSELILNNSTLTHYEDCDDPWQGIEVWGNSNKSQLVGTDGIMYQGKLTVNNSTIKNAWNAVTTQNPNGPNSHGGIIMAENSSFENNKRSIEIMKYENFNPYNTDIRMAYVSKFKNCTFTIDDNYLMPDFNTHMSMWNVYGLLIFGCDFLNNNTSMQHEGYGIFTSDAGFALLNFCDGPEPCIDDNIVQNEFHNLYTGIRAYNVETYNRPYVDGAEFINNSIGVYLSSVKNAIIINSNFEVGHNHLDIPSCGYSMGYGIDMVNSYGFAIEENEFTRYSSIPNSYYTGIRASNCPSDVDVIYKNNFQLLNYGNYAYGTNRFDPDDERYGLKYECNTNSYNVVDFIVTHEYEWEAMIHSYQGTNNVMANGNTFSNIVLPEQWHFRQEGTRDINWYYCDDGTNCPNQDPTKVYQIHPDHFQKNVQPANPCLSHYGSGGDIKLSSTVRQQIETEYALNLSDYDNVKMLYDNLEDGGNTTAELLDVQTAIPDEMWTIRTQLLGDSPHLSQEVLKEVADRTDVFPESVIFDIMAANPDEMKKEELLSYLENKEDPLPDYMISILRDLSMGSTYKTVLLNDMAYYNSERIKAAQNIIQSILADSIVNTTDYRNWLDNIGTMGADKQIISSYLSEGDTSNALSLLSILPGLYNLQDEQLDAYSDYSFMVNLSVNLIRENRNIYQLDSLEITDLVWLADSSSGDARSQARNILEFAYDYSYCDCLYVSDSLTMKLSDKTYDEYNLHTVGEIEVAPNPARDWAEFNYQLPLSMHEGNIIITDITGNIIESIKVAGNQGVKLWDTRNIPNGVYLYTLSTAGFSTTNKVVINH